MTKAIKQMQMTAIHDTFKDVRDLVVLGVKGLDSQSDYTFRANLRKKNIKLQVAKNTLTRKVFGNMGMSAGGDSPYWSGPTLLAWGAPGSSIAEVSRAIETELKNAKMAAAYKDKLTIKGAIAEGSPVPFDIALKLPTRLEAIGEIVGMILGPGAAIAGCLVGPASQVASQIATIGEKKEEEPAATPA